MLAPLIRAACSTLPTNESKICAMISVVTQSKAKPRSRINYRKMPITLVDCQWRSLAQQLDSEDNCPDPASCLGFAVTDSEPSFVKPYRCRDCGGGDGVRSRRRTWTERIILPLFLMRPVRCAACFRRDYWSIFTSVRERSERDTSASGIHRNAA